MNTPAAILETEGLTKQFGGVTAVDKVNLKVNEGEVLGVIGPNGAGKSTIFNLISCSLTPTKGSIKFLQKPTVGKKPHQLAKMGLMRTFQHNQPFPSMSLIENVMIGATPAFGKNLLAPIFGTNSRTETGIRRQAEGLLAFVGLTEFAGVEVTNLSFGQGRLLEVARALAGNPRFLLLDEPAAGLTISECERLAGIIREVRSRKMAVMLIEHDMHFLMPLVDRVIVLNFGAKIAEGTPGEVKQNPAVMEAYLGEAGGLGVA